MTIRNERGIALVLALFLTAAMSVLAASLMFLAQTETYASMNYRMMSQARYAAEAGIQRAAYFLNDPAQYQQPSSINGGDPYSAYTTGVSPVLYSAAPVMLSADSTVTANYPVTAVQTAYAAAAQGTLTAANATLTYRSYAKLLSMNEFPSYGNSIGVVQTWLVTGIGSLQGSKATVEVMAIIETRKVPGTSYAAFATANNCGALNFQGDTIINSYDSSTLDGATVPTPDPYDGDVGTNGNLSIGGSVDVQGNLYTPRTGVGSCAEGNITALSSSGTATVEGSIIPLPKNISYPTPPVYAPSVLPEVNLNNIDASACGLLGLTYGAPDAGNNPVSPANCTVVLGGPKGDEIIINGFGADLTLPSLKLTGQIAVTLVANDPPAQYRFNSIDLGAQGDISVKATTEDQAVTVSIIGKDNLGVDIATPLDMLGGSFSGVNTCLDCSTLCPSCSSYDATMLTFVYGGTGEVKLAGGAGAAATVYAPNADIELGGTFDLYGALVGKTVDISGTGDLHYDRSLQDEYFIPGQPMLGTFTWKRF